MDRISGQLRCKECNELICIGSEWTLNSGEDDFISYDGGHPDDHICAHRRITDVDWLLNNGIAFPYDFNSPLTIREQIQQWIDTTALERKNNQLND